MAGTKVVKQRRVARSSADDHQLEEAYLFDALLAHSLGVGFSIHFEVLGRLLNHRRRVPDQRTCGSPHTGRRGREEYLSSTPLPVLRIARGTI